MVFTVASYVVVLTTMSAGLPLIVGSILAVVVAMVVGCGIEVAIYRPLRKVGATMFVIFIAALGVYIAGENIIHILFGAAIRHLGGFPITSLFVGPVTFTTLHVLTAVVSMTAISAVYFYLTRSKAGTALRAVASNPVMAEAVGIDKGRIFVLAYGLGSALMALGAILWSLDKDVLPHTSIIPLFISFIVALIGGIGSIPGSVVGGLILGMAENLSLLWIPAEYKTIAAYVVLSIAILVRPAGIFPSEIKRLI